MILTNNLKHYKMCEMLLALEILQMAGVPFKKQINLRDQFPTQDIHRQVAMGIMLLAYIQHADNPETSVVQCITVTRSKIPSDYPIIFLMFVATPTAVLQSESVKTTKNKRNTPPTPKDYKILHFSKMEMRNREKRLTTT